MRFKDYVWPHNPRVYEIAFQKDVVSHKVPFGTCVLQNMGRRHRVLRGEGEFAGAGAYAEFQRLASVFYDTTPGVLTHPLWNTARAYFVALRLKQEPAENYVAYAFEFWECYDAYPHAITPVAVPAAAASRETASVAGTGTGGAEYYTAVYGDCLWNIARDNGLTLSELLALNPQVRNPNILMVGDSVRVK